MIELANHILFLSQIQTEVDLVDHVQAVIESWILRGDPMPNQFIYETAELFTSIGYRSRVVQWITQEQAFDQLVSATNNPALENVASPLDMVLSGSRVQQGYTSFTPWAMTSYGSSFHDPVMPQQQQSRYPSAHRADTRVDFNCMGCPSCNFCTKVKNDMLKHEAQH